ncbi:PiggyBac transposable elementderived protein 3like, partial [Caligus rogercresseyi]
PIGYVKKYNKEQRKKIPTACPNSSIVYSQHMDGVDLLDNSISNYRIALRTKKWYWALYNWFLNVQMVQAWRLYRRVGKLENYKRQASMSQVNFIKSCVSLVQLHHGYKAP